MAAQGIVEQVQAPGIVAGWARRADGGGPVALRVLLDGQVVGSGETGSPRPDLGGPHGYRIACAEPVGLPALAAGRLVVEALDHDGTPTPLRVVDRLRAAASAAFVRETLDALSADTVDLLLDALDAHPLLAERRAAAARLAETRRRDDEARAATGEKLAALPARRPPGGPAAAIAQIGVPAELLATDGSAVIGLGGMAFLLEGSNGLLGQYAKPEWAKDVAAATQGWLRLIDRRARQVRALGPGFLQLLIPEKLTVLSDLLTREITVPTPLWRALAGGIAAEPTLAAHTLSALDVLRQPPLREASFPRFDTHLTARAAHAVFGAACAAMGFAQPFPQAAFTAEQVETGDLSHRFIPGVRMPEVILMPDQDFVDSSSDGLVTVERLDPGRHVGTRYVWRRETAPIRAKVVAFGNSFFERGGSARCLSWWFARAFSEFHFVWSPDMDADYIRAQRPDWVICQTIERFLPQVPAA